MIWQHIVPCNASQWKDHEKDFVILDFPRSHSSKDFKVFLVRCYAFYRISTKRCAEKYAGKPSVGRGDARQLQTFHGSKARQGT